MSPELALEFFDTNDDGFLSWEEFLASWEEDGDDDHDGHDDGHEAEIPSLMEIFNESDTNMDDLLDINELEEFIHEVMELEGDEHEGHEHAEAEKIIQNPGACPADTNIQVFHMEAGEHVLEFESEHDEDFNMAVLKMLGGHAHHDHGDHGEDHDDHDDHDNDMVCYDMSTHTVDSTITTEEDCEAAGLMWTAANSGPGDEDHGEDHDGEYCHNTTTHENYYNVDEANCEAAGHVWMSDDDHDDHGDHGDEMCHNTDTHENYESTEEDCEAAGHMWMGHEGHHDLPEIHSDRVAHTLSFPIHIAGDWVDEWGAEHSIDSDSWNDNTITHYDNHEMWAVAQNSEDDQYYPGLWSKYDWTWESEELYYCQSTFGADTEADAMSAESANASDLATGCGGFPWSLMEEVGHDDHSDEEGGHDDHGDDDHSDEEGGHDDHGDDHHEIGAVIIHIEEEGDYGFAMPSDIEFFVIMGEGGHDDHDDHGDDHDDHSDEEGDHDDHSDEIEADGGEEAFDYDPHSWLDPLSFNEQLKLVQDKLTMTFPDGTDAFAENTEAYSAQLTQLHDSFEAALGDDGTCVTGGFDKTIVANHNAYSYISVRYDIDILTVHGLDPEGEPSPAEVAEVVDHIKEEGIAVLFVEEYTDQSAVQSIVEETGVEVQILYTMEMLPSDDTDDYLSMMNKNIGNIVSGIGC
jgi:zinc transport system substrate-binding protein